MIRKKSDKEENAKELKMEAEQHHLLPQGHEGGDGKQRLDGPPGRSPRRVMNPTTSRNTTARGFMLL